MGANDDSSADQPTTCYGSRRSGGVGPFRNLLPKEYRTTVLGKHDTQLRPVSSEYPSNE